MKAFLFILQFFLLTFCFTQNNVILNDEFINNSNAWQEGKTIDGSVDVHDKRGFYIIQHKRNYDAWTAWKELEINENRDFEIEASCYKDNGVKNYGYGILWGGTDNNYYSFMITGNGYFCVGKVVDGVWVDITPDGWIKTNVVNEGNNKYNSLTTRKKGGSYEFEVNNTLVLKIKCGSFFGNKIGFNVNNKQRILVDWIRVKYLN